MKSDFIPSLYNQIVHFAEGGSLLKGVKQLQHFFASLQPWQAEEESCWAENLYARAFCLYRQGDYEQAETLFRLLSRLLPLNSKYIYAQAASMQQNEKWKEAISTYWRALTLDAQQIEGYYRIAECALQLGKKREARLALRLFLCKAKRKENFAKLYREAELLSSQLKKKKKKKNQGEIS